MDAKAHSNGSKSEWTNDGRRDNSDSTIAVDIARNESTIAENNALNRSAIANRFSDIDFSNVETTDAINVIRRTSPTHFQYWMRFNLP